MKTNQLMSVVFEHGTLHIEHKTAMGELADIFSIGNSYRHFKKQAPLNITYFISSKGTQEFIAAVSKRLNIPASELVYTKGRGKTARVMANIFILIYAAEHLNPDFHVEVIDVFLNQKLLEWRDSSGDNFKALNEEFSSHAMNVLGKPAHNGHFITLAKIINARVGDGYDVDWNIATSKQLKERGRIEMVLSTMIKVGVVKDWEHLKQLAADV
jgi:hypothetical protein